VILGSDVSHWRPVVDLDEYRASGREFLITKASDHKDGRWFTDPTFQPNREGCESRGIIPGGYMFLRSYVDPKLQVAHFLSVVVDPHGLILAVDFERATVSPNESEPTLAQLNAAISAIHQAVGRWPWVYTNRGWWNAIGNPPGPTQCPLWHSEWRSTMGAMYGGWIDPIAWQYTDAASVPGLPPAVDDNRFNGTRLDLEQEAGMSAQDRGWGPPCPSTSIVRIEAGGRGFNVHKRVARIFKAFVTELVDRGYNIDRGQLDDWSYNCRKIAGSTSWSNHASMRMRSGSSAPNMESAALTSKPRKLTVR